jgi:hypothetical protein
MKVSVLELVQGVGDGGEGVCVLSLLRVGVCVLSLLGVGRGGFLEHFFCFSSVFETKTFYVAQASIELSILCPLPHQCLDYRHAPPCLASWSISYSFDIGVFFPIMNWISRKRPADMCHTNMLQTHVRRVSEDFRTLY